MMTRPEREDLLKVCRLRTRVAKAEAAAVAAKHKADFQRQLATEYHFDQQATWKAAYQAVAAVTAKANEEIRARAKELGIPREFMPSISSPYWYDRGENMLSERRAELTRVAYTKIDQMQKEAVQQIERASAEIQTQLVADGLESAQAKAFLESMPTADQLIPVLSIEEAQKLLPRPRYGTQSSEAFDEPESNE
jgi:hypothetical protein